MTSSNADAGDARVLPIAVAVVVLAAAIVAVVLRPWDRGGRAILVVGDSVTYLSASEISGRFGDDEVQIIARPGYRSLDLEPLLRKRLEQGPEPEIGIFLVGYNDVRRETVDSRDLPVMVEQSAELECAVWLTLPARPGGQPAGDPSWDPQRFDQWNARLAEEVEDHPNVHLVSDWRALVTDGDPDQLLTEDHIHPSDAGSRRLADAMARAVERVCQP